MKDQFEDQPPCGDGKPTVAETIETRDYLKRHNRKHSLEAVRRELMINGFTTSRATMQRHLKEVPGGNPPNPKEESPIQPAERRRTNARKRAKANAKDAASPVADAIGKAIAGDPGSLEELTKLLDKEISSTQLAIDENRVRMALNIILMRRLAMKADLVLLDMRGAAAMLDAFTVGTKLSGGASIDISIPAGGRGVVPHLNGNGNGHDMVRCWAATTATT
jgi:hypothetical protein